MLIDLIRKVIPMRKRQDIGLWTAEKAGKHKIFAYPYFLLLCGKVPKGLKLLPNHECSVSYNGNEIVSPRDGILAFIEVFQDMVYEKYWSPKEGDIVIDAGAYVGAFSIRASELVGNKGRVIAIEPEPKNLSYLKRNLANLDNATVAERAISNHDGTGALYISGASPCHTLLYQHKDSVEVKVDTLDEIVKLLGLPRVDFIKMDIEGMELQALEGAREILKGNVKLAIAAYHTLPSGEPELPAVVRLLESLGYKTNIASNYVYAERKA